MRDNVIRDAVALFVFTLLFAVRAINRIEGSVPQLSVCVIGVLGLVCLAAFLFLIDYAARLLRPVSLVNRVGHVALKVIDSVYPEPIAAETLATTTQEASPVERTIQHRGRSSIILSVNL